MDFPSQPNIPSQLSQPTILTLGIKEVCRISCTQAWLSCYRAKKFLQNSASLVKGPYRLDREQSNQSMRLEFTCVCIPFCSDYSVKSSQLLYILLYHLEDHVTHQLQSVLTGLYHSAQDDEQVVVKQVRPLHTIRIFYKQ